MGTRALTTLGHLGIRALETLRDSKGTWALGHSKHLGTEALRQSGTQRALRHSRHSVYSVVISTSFFWTVISWLTEIFSYRTVLDLEFSQVNTTSTRSCNNVSFWSQTQRCIIIFTLIFLLFYSVKNPGKLSILFYQISWLHMRPQNDVFSTSKKIVNLQWRSIDKLFSSLFFSKFISWNFRVCKKIYQSFYFLSTISVINFHTTLI